VTRYWTVWLLLVALTFAAPEIWALATGRQPLTGFVRATTKRHLAVIYLLGALTGWAFMHFWGAGWCG
jgi:hypothetical protein